MNTRLFLSVLALAAAACAPAAMAQKQEREAPAASGQLSEVGKGRKMGRKDLQPGAFITPKYRQAVQDYLAKNHGPGQPCLVGRARHGESCAPAGAVPPWKIGKALPKGVALMPAPAGLLAALPPAPPGNRYVVVGGDILLVASVSRIVVDAVPATR
jgi:hypothetical protein